MDNCKFYIARYENNTVGNFIDIESEFKGIKYKSISGLNDYGKPNNKYVETYAGCNKADVFISEEPSFEQTTIKLTLLFFDPDNNEDESLSYSACEALYYNFINFISGCKLIYRDTVRKRKVLMSLELPIKPTKDILYNQPYMEAEFIFENVFGCSFGYDEAFPTE